MNIFKNFLITFMGYLLVNVCFAQSIEFFASNNTRTLPMETAYVRLKSTEQQTLQSKMIRVLQKNHIEQGEFAEVLGLSLMLNKNVTADNAERFNSSPYQHLSTRRIYSIARNLAITLKQESIAVFIPSHSTIGNTTVHFVSHKPRVKELVTLIRQQLSPIHSQAFSLYIVDDCNGFKDAKVVAIEWLGHKIDFKEIKKLFHDEKVELRYGKAYLVYQDGNITEI